MLLGRVLERSNPARLVKTLSADELDGNMRPNSGFEASSKPDPDRLEGATGARSRCKCISRILSSDGYAVSVIMVI